MPTLDFKGKQIVYAHHLTVPARTLEVDAPKSLPAKGQKPSLDDNLIIHGDNLHALKALMPRYAGRVHCIYIDPPYNTGNEKWVYNDNVNSPLMQEWLKDKSPVDGEDLERHDKWLCMMWPRLHLLRELLAENGVIFVSIDDNEVQHLRMIMDEIFGEEHFICDFIWHSEGHTDNQFPVKVNHEYILCYGRDGDHTELGFVVDPSTREESNLWKGFAENSITKNGPGNPPSEVTLPVGFPCKAEALSLAATRIPDGFIEDLEQQVMTSSQLKRKYSGISFPLRLSPLEVQASKLEKPCKVLSGWANLNKLNRFIENGCVPIPDKNEERLSFYLSENGVIYYRREREQSRNILSVLQEFGTTEQQRSELETIGTPFSYPKPKPLISHLIQIGTVDENAIILDSFAGSGTTAQAVLALNQEGGGNRKFILVQCDEYDKDKRAGGLVNITDKITAERVRRVIKGVPKAKDESLKNGLGGSFTYCTLGEEISPEKMLTGENLPDYDTLARHLVYTATGHAPDKIRKAQSKDGLFHETDDRLFYLIYEPELAFLRSADSALNGDRAERIAKQAKTKHKTAVVFATHKFMGQKELTEMGIVFCGLPYESLSG